jgi:hypothetical protein
MSRIKSIAGSKFRQESSRILSSSCHISRTTALCSLATLVMLAAMQQESFWRRAPTVVKGYDTRANTSIQNSSTRDLIIGVSLVAELSADLPDVP